MKKIILASSSPRRKELLKTLGIAFEVHPSDFDESSLAIADPEKLPRALALAKAKAVAQKVSNAIVIGADTIVAAEGEVFGKPKDARHAKKMLQTLNGRLHRVITGIAFYDADTHKFLTDIVETSVHFKTISGLEIDAYIKSGEPFGKAGGYAIQGLGRYLIEKIDGDYHNVVGLPIGVVAKKLLEFGFRPAPLEI